MSLRRVLRDPVVVALAFGAILALTDQPAGEVRSADRERLRPAAQPPTAPGGSGRDTLAGGGDRSLGIDADRPSDIPARGWWQIVRRTAIRFADANLMAQAAAVTFYGLLAIFPAITAMVSIYGLIADPRGINRQIAGLGGFVPEGGMQVINEQLHRLAQSPHGALGVGAIAGLLVAFWSANAGTKALLDALNVAYEERETRSYIRRTLLAFCFTFGAVLFVLTAIALVLVLPPVLGVIGLGGLSSLLLRLARWPVLFVAITVYLAFLYRYGPNRAHPRWRWVSWGSAIAAVLWVGGSVLFSWYAGNFGSYNKTYGSLGAAIGFMTWIWLSSLAVLLGAALDAEMEHQTGRDTTVGAPRPPGARGARMADQVATAAGS